MADRHDGGAAFPRPLPNIVAPPDEIAEMLTHYRGMSLRDFFAAHAAQGILAEGSSTDPVKIARAAYSVADELLLLREHP